MVFALAICVVVFEGWRRNWLAGIFLIFIPLTLSRADIGTLVFGFLLVLLFHPMRARNRLIGLASLLVIPAVALTVPVVRTRILSTLSSNDTGANDRYRAIRDFPNTMSGHWLVGLGWGRPEFKIGDLAFKLNYVSNAPLITVYRGGIFTGLAFVGVLVIGCVLGYRALRSPSTAHAILGGLFISACLVAFQLDHTVASGIQPVMLLSAFLAFLVYVNQTPGTPPETPQPVLQPASRHVGVARGPGNVTTLPPADKAGAAPSAG